MTDQELFSKWFLADGEAVDFAERLWGVMQEWDDLVDEGKVDRANEVLSFMIFGMKYHPFYARCEAALHPVLLSAYLDWRDATAIEKTGDEADLEKAFMLRAGIYRVYSVMAWLIGGEGHSAVYGPEIHRAYTERLADYIKEKTDA